MSYCPKQMTRCSTHKNFALYLYTNPYRKNPLVHWFLIQWRKVQSVFCTSLSPEIC